MEPAETRYLERGGGAFAYEVFGCGDNVVLLGEINIHLDLVWGEPHMHALFERIAERCRVAIMQCRGFGLSDSTATHPTLEEQADDAVAVMDALGMQSATLVTTFSTAGPAALVAARAPERVRGIVMLNPFAQGAGVSAPDAWEPAEQSAFLDGYAQVVERWGQGLSAAMWHPSLGSAYNRRLCALIERCSASPARARSYYDWVVQLDLRDLFRQPSVPVRVLYSPGGALPEPPVRRVAELLPNATFHVLPEPPYGVSFGEYFSPVLTHVEEVATGTATTPAAVRLGAVLFTDLVASTELLARRGDHAFSELRSDHERQARVAVERFDGEVRNVAGDGTLSIFDGTARAVECGLAIAADAAALGLDVRAGVHTGELEQSHLSLTGMTVHVAARVMAQAGPGQLLVTRPARDLAADDQDLAFAPHGTVRLRGVLGEWELWSARAATAAPAQVVAPRPTAVDRIALRTTRYAPPIARAVARIANAAQRRRLRKSPGRA